LLAGCGSGVTSPSPTPTPTPAPTPVPTSGYAGAGFSASVAAGTQPVTGASVDLYAAGTTGNGSAATLLTAGLATDATGSVTIAASYYCPTSASELYLVSRGGKVGSAASANASLVLMAGVGACGQVASGQKVVVNEATTVAGMAALAPFYAAGGMVGASATNTTGIANAFATASELVNPVTGTAPGTTLPSTVTAPAARMNSLANAVNACAVGATACSALFAAATTASGAPSNTLDALYNIVRQPANGVAGTYAVAQGSSVYGPALTAAPTDWTLFLTVSGGGMNGPSGLGVDSTGSVWVANYFGVASKFTALGAASFASGITGSGLNNSYGLAMDLSDNAWIPNEQPYSAAGTGSVSELSASGMSLAGAKGYTAGGMNYPISTAVDPNGTVWVVDYGNSHLTLLNASGVPLSGTTGYSSGLFAFPVAVVVDGNHFGWVANQAGTTVTKVAADGTSFTNYNCCNGASGLAIDAGNNVWVANYYGNSVSLISSAGTVVSNGAYTGGGGIDHPQGIAIDGAGNAWVANFRAPYLTELSGTNAGLSSAGAAITPATGYGTDAGLLEAYAIAADASGSLWVSNFGSNTVTKFLGLATPVKTPLSGVAQIP
jgi:hypothetical protein